MKTEADDLPKTVWNQGNMTLSSCKQKHTVCFCYIPFITHKMIITVSTQNSGHGKKILPCIYMYKINNLFMTVK